MDPRSASPLPAAPVLGVLISGRGSNLQAIIDAIGDGRLAARIGVVISNRSDAGGLEKARAAGIATAVIEHKAFPTRAAFEHAPGPVLNVHPSLLPAFPGVDAQHQAWTHGVKVAGATVHLVTPELDAGPIVVQATVPVEEADTPDSLAARILVEEHRIYPEAIARVLTSTWRVEGRRFVRR